MTPCECVLFAVDGTTYEIAGHHENCSEVSHLVQKFYRILATGIPHGRFDTERSWGLAVNGELVTHGQFTDEEKAALYRAAENTGEC